MARFVLLDQSLREQGGHHFDYARHTLQAARELGFETVLACHCKFREHASLPDNCSVLPVFRHHTYSRYSDFVGIRNLFDSERRGFGRLVERYKEIRHERGRIRRIDSFARGCAKLFQKLDLGPSDHILATTVADLELLGLAQFLRDRSDAPCPNWHLQFHFNIFSGREPEYASQEERGQRVASRFREALRDVGGDQIRFYNTSAALARQYDHLGVARFEQLTYPINPALHASKRPQRARPLRITSAGELRGEKGGAHLRHVVSELWEDCFASGDAQLVIQSKDRCTGQLDPVSRDDTELGSAVEQLPYPLDSDAYADLVRRADIGLFMYDARRYYARRAGVLGEFLAAGVPVIVPAGSWLAEQIAEPIYAYQLGIADRLVTMDNQGTTNVNWLSRDRLQSSDGGSLSFGSPDNAATAVLDCPPGATKLLVSFRWNRTVAHGHYLRCDVTQHGAPRGNALFASVVGQRVDSRVPVLVPIASGTRSIEVGWSNPYNDQQLCIERVRFQFLRDDGPPSAIGAVGLIAADANQVPLLLREMIGNHSHYRETACRFAADWHRRHDPRTTVLQLVGNALGSRPSEAV